jgi:hypothetical protein
MVSFINAITAETLGVIALSALALCQNLKHLVFKIEVALLAIKGNIKRLARRLG